MDTSDSEDLGLKIIGLLEHCVKGKKVHHGKTEVIILAFEEISGLYKSGEMVHTLSPFFSNHTYIHVRFSI